jgi:hypothetical protein
MPNPYHGALPSDRGDKSGAPPKAKPGHKPDSTPMKTANWGGLPGGTQPRTRDKAGTRKVNASPKSEGI